MAVTFSHQCSERLMCQVGCACFEEKSIQNASSDAYHPLPHSTDMGGVRRIKHPGTFAVMGVCLQIRILCVKVEFLTCPNKNLFIDPIGVF